MFAAAAAAATSQKH